MVGRPRPRPGTLTECETDIVLNNALELLFAWPMCLRVQLKKIVQFKTTKKWGGGHKQHYGLLSKKVSPPLPTPLL